MKRLLAIVLLFALSAPAQFTVPARTGATAVAPSSGGATVTDDFNRANGALGANWTDWTGNNKVVIASNQVHSNHAWYDDAVVFYTAANFANDQWAQITVKSIASNNDSIALLLRSSQGTGATFTGYQFKCGGTGCSVAVCTNSTNLGNNCTQIRNTGGQAPAVGDVIKASVTGTSIDLQRNGASMANFPHTDATFSSGRPGMGFGRGASGTDPQGDDFSAGPTQ